MIYACRRCGNVLRFVVESARTPRRRRPSEADQLPLGPDDRPDVAAPRVPESVRCAVCASDEVAVYGSFLLAA